MRSLLLHKKIIDFARRAAERLMRGRPMPAQRWLTFVCFVAAPALGAVAIGYRLSLQTGFWRTAPHSSQTVAATLMLILAASLLLLYLVFILMIFSWDIDRISYAVEEEAQRQFLKRIAPDSAQSFDNIQAPIERGKDTSAVDAVLNNLIARRAEFLWQNLLHSGCLDFPRANVKLAIKTIREEHPTGDAGLLDALKTLIASKLFARRYVPRLRLKIMDKLVFKFVREISLLFVSVWIVFLASVLLWPVLSPGVFSAKAEMSSIVVFVADLTLRGAIFTIVDHLGLSLTHLTPSPNAKTFLIHTLAFRLFMSLFVIATIIKIIKLLVRRRAAAA